MDEAGNVYGATSYGGGGAGSGAGTIFRYAPDGRLATIATFDGVNGKTPTGGVILDAAGHLYTATQTGGSGFNLGGVFAVPTAGGSPQPLITFSGSTGGYPIGGITADPAGNLYGTTTYVTGAAANASGNLFKLTPAGERTTLANFEWANGGHPQSDLLIDETGNLYGTTYEGGAAGSGAVFKFDAITDALTTLVSFSGANGAGSISGLTRDAIGNLYGTTSRGGAKDLGTLFKVTPDGTLVTLMSFDGKNGGIPGYMPIVDAAGNLYGTTAVGGTFGHGTLFRLSYDGVSFETLYSFAQAPSSPLLAAPDGTLYGATSTGGANNAGTLFRLMDSRFVVTVPEPAHLCLFLTAIALHRRSRR